MSADKIKKKNYNLKAGDVIVRENQGDTIIIKNEYNSFHGCYECREVTYDEDDNEIVLEEDYAVTPYDLVNGILIR